MKKESAHEHFEKLGGFPTSVLATAEAPARERPILFSARLVRAILAGGKTQTRRIVHSRDLRGNVDIRDGELSMEDDDTGEWVDLAPIRWGRPGDRLWVRETWAPNETEAWGWIYRADTDGKTAADIAGSIDSVWHPSIFMARRASRIDLEVTAVRVERLQEITEADAIAEGVSPEDPNPVTRFALQWDQIYGKRAAVIDNPWVWVVSFRRIRP